MVPAEIELGAVAVQVFLADVVKGADDPALNEREIALGGVDVDAATGKFVGAVVDGLVPALEIEADPAVAGQFVRENGRGPVYHAKGRFSERHAVHPFEGFTVYLASAIDKGHHGRFRGSATALTGGLTATPLAADVGLVDFHDAPIRTKQAGHFAVLHRPTNAVAQVPRRLVRAEPKLALQLERTHALLGGADQVEREHPRHQRELGFVHDRADRDRELLATLGVVALENAVAVLFAAELRNVVGFAMRAIRTFRPPDAFKQFAGFGFRHLGYLQDVHFDLPC